MKPGSEPDLDLAPIVKDTRDAFGLGLLDAKKAVLRVVEGTYPDILHAVHYLNASNLALGFKGGPDSRHTYCTRHAIKMSEKSLERDPSLARFRDGKGLLSRDNPEPASDPFRP